MNLTSVKQFVTSSTGRQMLRLRKNSPHILFGAGVVGVVATAVTTARSTLKIEEVLDEHASQMELIERGRTLGSDKYTENDARRDTVVQYSKTIMKLCKLYSLPITLGTLSIAALAGSHHIMSARNVAMGAAFASIERAFENYRQRVIAELGPEKDREFRYDVERLEVIEETKTGPQPKNLTRVDGNQAPGLYSFFFSKETTRMWSPIVEYNLTTLRHAQSMMNDRLKRTGYLFLNDALDMLDMQRVPHGQVVGWLYKGDGDGFVDLGVWDPKNTDRFVDFVTGREDCILLEFNVDGDIMNKI